MIMPNIPTIPIEEKLASQRILDAIASRSLQMKPKWKFMTEHVLTVVALVMAGVGLVYLGSFVSFLWRTGHFSSLTSFGLEGFKILWFVFPWWHILLVLVGLVAVLYLMRKHTVLYRWPMAISFGIFGIALIGAAVVTERARIHDWLAERVLAEQQVPLLSPFYTGYREIIQSVITPAEIVKANGQLLIVETEYDTLRIILTKRTQLPADWHPQPGQEIIVVGRSGENAVTAMVIETVENLSEPEPFRVFEGDREE
jgi:hypothetical protein